MHLDGAVNTVSIDSKLKIVNHQIALMILIIADKLEGREWRGVMFARVALNDVINSCLQFDLCSEGLCRSLIQAANSAPRDELFRPYYLLFVKL
jgi:hypothetical protein